MKLLLSLLSLLLGSLAPSQQYLGGIVRTQTGLTFSIQDNYCPGTQSAVPPGILGQWTFAPNAPYGGEQLLFRGTSGVYSTVPVLNGYFSTEKRLCLSNNYNDGVHQWEVSLSTDSYEVWNRATCSDWGDIVFELYSTVPLNGVLRIETFVEGDNVDTTQPQGIAIVGNNSGLTQLFMPFSPMPMPIIGPLRMEQTARQDRYVVNSTFESVSFNIIQNFSTTLNSGLNPLAFSRQKVGIRFEYLEDPTQGVSPGVVTTVTNMEPAGLQLNISDDKITVNEASKSWYGIIHSNPTSLPPNTVHFAIVGFPLLSPILLSSGCTIYCDGSLGAYLMTPWPYQTGASIAAPVSPNINYYIQTIAIDFYNPSAALTSAMLYVN